MVAPRLGKVRQHLVVLARKVAGAEVDDAAAGRQGGGGAANHSTSASSAQHASMQPAAGLPRNHNRRRTALFRGHHALLLARPHDARFPLTVCRSGARQWWIQGVRMRRSGSLAAQSPTGCP